MYDLDQPTPRAVVSDDLTTIILNGVAQVPFPLGRTGLARALAGSRSSSLQADRFSLFGRLTNWTQKGIREQIAQLVEQGLLTHFEKDGYRLLRLTDQGQAWLAAHPLDRATITQPEPRPPKQAGMSSAAEIPTAHDQALYERLCAWRRALAQEIDKPAYVILHNRTLKQIAATHPVSLDELRAIRGIGPRKLEQYGQAILDIVTDQTPIKIGDGA